jgi:hemerythrin superfamily protein
LLLISGKKGFNVTNVLSGSEFLNDFFKPIKADMTRIKSFKKSRHGRRVKQLEKIEQKMKEERQKRIRERQKAFFGDVEAHRLAYLSVDI